MDLLVQSTHMKTWDIDTEYKYTDTREDEIDRKMSLKSMPMSLLLSNTKEKSLFCNVMDTPGHPNFMDEVMVSLRISDGVILVVDCMEGVSL